MSETVLDRLVDRLSDASAFNANAEVAPVALLWPDGGTQWSSVMHRLVDRSPVLQLGDYEVGGRQGPAYWMRCVVAGALPAVMPEGTPIVYLPGVDRGELRAVEACPSDLAPIAELQYRGQWFSHPNGRDWTVRAFLANENHGAGLQIADDAETADALLLALELLLDLPISRIEKQYLDADFFHSLVNPDPVQNLLDWINDPGSFKKRISEEGWTAFQQQSKAEFYFDPELGGPISAAEKLGRREGSWAKVWKRFADTPERYPGIPERLSKAKPLELVLDSPDTWPQDNETGEMQLRSLFQEMGALTAEGARGEIARLESEHSWRRATVWAKLEKAPLAFALEQLNQMAEVTSKPLTGVTIEDLVSDYVERGWRADDASVKALAATPDPDDRAAVSKAIASIYGPWLDKSAKVFQASASVVGAYEADPPTVAKKGTAILFVDGLRFDIAERLSSRLESSGLVVESKHSLAALPTVTPTAKAGLVPVEATALTGGPDFHAANAETGTKATIQVLRGLMGDQGVQILTASETGDPSGSAWVECGDIDRIGHDFGIRLVDQIEDEIKRVSNRVRELLDAGWPNVEVVTDHGWMLLPEGMERVDLPAATTDKKKGRCARLKDGADVAVPVVPWHWDQNIQIAIAPGAVCFEANKVYEHGGVSPQECIVQRLFITSEGRSREVGAVEIANVKWLGLQCRVELSGVDEGVRVDIRGAPAETETSIAEKAKEASTGGRISLIVPDEELIGEDAYVVALSAQGEVVAQRRVTVGTNK